MATTCDSQSYDLAEHFLQDDERYKALSEAEQQATAMSLALDIQQAVEDWFLERES